MRYYIDVDGPREGHPRSMLTQQAEYVDLKHSNFDICTAEFFRSLTVLADAMNLEVDSEYLLFSTSNDMRIIAARLVDKFFDRKLFVNYGFVAVGNVVNYINYFYPTSVMNEIMHYHVIALSIDNLNREVLS